MGWHVVKALVIVIFDRPDAACFFFPQLAAIMAWGAARPQGFGVCIMTDHEDYPELAEFYTHDRMSSLWFMNATLAGTVVITKASGAEQEVGTVEEALARVLELQRPAPDVAWSAQHNGHRPQHLHGS